MATNLIPASKATPCPVCQGTHKCSTTADGLILCGRTADPAPGFDHLGPCKDPTWHLFRPAAAGVLWNAMVRLDENRAATSTAGTIRRTGQPPHVARMR